MPIVFKQTSGTVVIRQLRPKFKFLAKMEMSFSQILAKDDLTNSNSF